MDDSCWESVKKLAVWARFPESHPRPRFIPSESDYQTIFNARGHHYNAAVSRNAAARHRERAALLDWLAPKAGETILDAPAGGGYVAEGLRARLGDVVKVICVEPARRFAAAINPVFPVLVAPLDATPLADGSVDAVASLAGLHHFADKRPVFREWARLLRPGGRLVLADVQADTDTARFLNGYVHEHTPGGHEGVFFEPGELSRDLEAAGFHEVQEQLLSVPWEFQDETAMAEFCHTLFSLTHTTASAVGAELPRWLEVASVAATLQMSWSLRYAVALRSMKT